MSDLAALLHEILTNRVPCAYPDCDERHFDYCRHETEDIAARLEASGVRVAAPRSEPICMEHCVSQAAGPHAPHPGENHDYRMTCTRCGEPGYLFVGYHSPGEGFTWTGAAALAAPAPKEPER